MPKKVNSLPKVFIPTPQGGRKPVEASKGASISAVLQKHGVLGLAAKRGMEKKDPKTGGWVKASLSCVLREGDVVRVRFAEQEQTASLGKLLTGMLKAAKRRERGPARDRRRRK